MRTAGRHVAPPAVTRTGPRALKRLGTARRTVRDTGVGALAYLIVQRLQQRTKPVAHLEWFRLMATYPTPRSGAIIPTWISDPGEAERLTGLGLDVDEVRERLSRGRCAAHFRDGDLAGYLWVDERRSYCEEGVTFHLGHDDVWIYDGRVAEQHRGQRIHPRLFAGIAHEAQAARERPVRLVSTIDAINASSIKAGSHRGGALIATYRLLKLGPLHVLRQTDADGAGWRLAFGSGISVPIPTKVQAPGASSGSHAVSPGPADALAAEEPAG